jgi:hypothetical protein
MNDYCHDHCMTCHCLAVCLFEFEVSNYGS